MHGLPDAPEPTGSIYVSTYPWTILPLYSCLMAYPGNSTDQRIHTAMPGLKRQQDTSTSLSSSFSLSAFRGPILYARALGDVKTRKNASSEAGRRV